MDPHKLWGGRFTNPTDSKLESLNCSLQIDKRMFGEDIDGSKAYAAALEDIGLLTPTEKTLICQGLEKIKLEWQNEEFIIKKGDEDIHTANERRLKELIGEPARKLHVGRSRNDQVSTDMKLWLKNNLELLKERIAQLIYVIILRSFKEIDVIMPGYTHLQQAQPVRWSHYLLSHAWNLRNDYEKLMNYLEFLDIMPLGSGALAGNPFNIDRIKLAENLNFTRVTENSLQAVGDRDYIADFLYWASLLGVHLSRFAEDFILFSSKEFNFLNLNETFSTGSSLMPQKRNPDSLELIRSIGGSLFGQCCGFMMVLKGLPSTYNKDLQNDKEPMFTTYDKLSAILEVATGVMSTITVNEENCKNALNFDMLATDIAYYLVRKGIPFRSAHHIAGKAVAEAEKQQISISKLNLKDLKSISSYFEEDIIKIWNYEKSIEQYQTIGGTGKLSVINQINSFKSWLLKLRKIQFDF